MNFRHRLFLLYFSCLCPAFLPDASAQDDLSSRLESQAAFFSTSCPVRCYDYLQSLQPDEATCGLAAFSRSQDLFKKDVTKLLLVTPHQERDFEQMQGTLRALLELRDAMLTPPELGTGNYLGAALISWVIAVKVLDHIKSPENPDQKSTLLYIARKNAEPLVPDIEPFKNCFLVELGTAISSSSLDELYRDIFAPSDPHASPKDILHIALGSPSAADLTTFETDSTQPDIAQLCRLMLRVERLHALCLLALSEPPVLSTDPVVPPSEKIGALRGWASEALGSNRAEWLVGPSSAPDEQWLRQFLSAKSMLRDLQEVGGDYEADILRAYFGFDPVPPEIGTSQ